MVANDLGLCRRCDDAAVATVKDTDEPLCWGHIMEAKKGGEFAIELSAPKRPRYDVGALREAIDACDYNVKTAHEWIAQEEARKADYWDLIEQIEAE